MKDGFLRVAAGTPKVSVADPAQNALEVIALMREAAKTGAKLLVLPELSLTGYTAADLLLLDRLQQAALQALSEVVKASRGLDIVLLVGLPLVVAQRLYNCAAVVQSGELLGLIPKKHLPNYGEFQELRYFSPGEEAVRAIECLGHTVNFGVNQLFQCAEMPEFVFAAEICEDLWAPDAPGVSHALAGATVLCNLSASDEIVGKAAYREMLLKSQSARLVAGYLYADAGEGESTTDLVFAGHNLIAENGTLLAASKRYESGLIFADLDLAFLQNERIRLNTFHTATAEHVETTFHIKPMPLSLDRFIDPTPFVPYDDRQRAKRCEDVFDIQAQGLATRMAKIGCKHLVLGVSGGLDSTLALLVAVRACDRLKLRHDAIHTVTMPGFGTTGRTKSNACRLAEMLGTRLSEISIDASVRQHFKDIGHDENIRDVTYENAQARERTQILMDLANQEGALVVGTGDLSELALGFATYNGDHMSMYGVNASVPKTLVRHLVRYVAELPDYTPVRETLTDVLNTPVSPELLPAKDGEIAQVTEELVGPYELTDFFLYHFLRRMSGPAKIRRLANLAFEGVYSEQMIDTCLGRFLKRFFAQQYKRSCMPDGPKTGSVSLSPRGDFRMPSDASVEIFLSDLD